MPLDSESAKSFHKYYRNMRSHTKSQSGGMAPLDYGMTPGLNPGAYGRFPVAIDTDPQSIQNLDVYFQNSLTKGCGTENSSLAIPEGMSSNLVGGRSRKNHAANRKNSRKANRKANRKATRANARTLRSKLSRKSARKTARRQHGGIMDITSLPSAIYSRPYMADVPTNTFQSIGAAVTGSTTQIPLNIPNPPSPVDKSWSYLSHGMAGIINPGNVTPIGDQFSALASPAPWQTQQ
jgi:hypothetical protein